MRKDAAKALESLVKDAKKENLKINGISGFRSYQSQKEIYLGYVRRLGEKKANQISAKPGQSEHQTALAMDVSTPSVGNDLVESFGNIKEGKWLVKNAHKYRFVIRYQKGKEKITGYSYEPWHLRYVSKHIAKVMYEEKLTYEEFYKKYYY